MNIIKFTFFGVELEITDQSTEEIRNFLTNSFAEKNPTLPFKMCQEIIENFTAFLACPLQNQRVTPMNCHFCPYGHMTECHYPLSCQEKQCSHYQSNAINEE